MEAIGKKKWIIPGGYISLKSNGKEPAMVSQNKLAILNTSTKEAQVNLTVYYNSNDPVKNYTVKIKPQRVKKFRINDLIDPLPVSLETEYSLEIDSDIEVVVQFLHMTTSQKQLALMGTIGFGTDL